MTRPLLAAFLLISFSRSFSQSNNYKHTSTLGVSFILNDFKNSSVSGRATNIDAGLSLIYLNGINSHFDYSINISGSFPDSVSTKLSYSEKALLLQGDVSIRVRLLGKSNWINPFIQSGIGIGS